MCDIRSWGCVAGWQSCLVPSKTKKKEKEEEREIEETRKEGRKRLNQIITNKRVK
jgi:hypothetical protein